MARNGVRLLIENMQFPNSRLTALQLASSPTAAAVKICGGCASLTPSAVNAMYDSIVPAFEGAACTVIGGGTSMRIRGTNVVLPGITEVLPWIHDAHPEVVVVGVAPRQTAMQWLPGTDLLVIDDQPENPYVTTVHPGLQFCLVLQYSADRGAPDWDAEWMVALDYLEVLRESPRRFRTAHLLYGGGKTTERELLHVVNLPHDPDNPWWVILVSDSGGVAGQYASDREFCTRYQDNLVVCTAAEIASVLAARDFTKGSRR